MPASYCIYPELGYVSVVAAGALSMGDLIKVLSDLKADSRFNPSYRCLTDCSQLDRIEVPPFVATQAAKLAVFERNARRAFVSRNPKLAGLIHHYVSELKPGTVEIFSRREDAVGFLNAGLPSALHVH